MNEVYNWLESVHPKTIALSIILLTVASAWLVNRLFARFLRRMSQDLNSDPTNYKFLRHATMALIYIAGFSWSFSEIESLRGISQSLLAGAGILTIAIGLASQTALSNIVSGLFIVLFKPFRVNDSLIIKDQFRGVVEDITLRHTILRDADNRQILIPNAVINQEILINSDQTGNHVQKQIDVPVTYRTNLDWALETIREIASSHPLRVADKPRTDETETLSLPPAPVRIHQLTENHILLRVTVWGRTPAEALTLQSDILGATIRAFRKEGVEFPQASKSA